MLTSIAESVDWWVTTIRIELHLYLTKILYNICIKIICHWNISCIHLVVVLSRTIKNDITHFTFNLSNNKVAFSRSN